MNDSSKAADRWMLQIRPVEFRTYRPVSSTPVKIETLSVPDSELPVLTSAGGVRIPDRSIINVADEI